MNQRLLRAGSLAAAAVAIGGVLLLVVPQHATTIGALVIVTGGVAAALHALAVNVPEWSEATWLTSPFNHRSRSSEGEDGSGEAERLRRRLEGRRQPIRGGPAIPPSTLRLLQPLIRAQLELEGLDPRREQDHPRIARRLSPLTLGILETRALERVTRFRTRAADPDRVAAVVLKVLDDLDESISPEPGTRP